VARTDRNGPAVRDLGASRYIRASEPRRIPATRDTRNRGAVRLRRARAGNQRAVFKRTRSRNPPSGFQSIVRDGHWLLPADAYGYTDRKPPLFYWLSAIVAKSTGGTVDEVRARAVSVVAGIALAIAVLAWTVANVGTIEGWLAFPVHARHLRIRVARDRSATTDMLLTFLLFAAYSAIYPLLDSPTPDLSRRKIFVGVMLGLGILTKGPVADRTVRARRVDLFY